MRTTGLFDYFEEEGHKSEDIIFNICEHLLEMGRIFSKPCHG